MIVQFFNVAEVLEGDYGYVALRHEIQGLLSITGKLWIGGLDSHVDFFGNRVQGRQISRIGLADNEYAVLGYLAQLAESEYHEAEVFGEQGGKEIMSGVVIRPFYNFEEDGIEKENQCFGIIVDVVNDEGWLRAYPSDGNYDTWRGVMIVENESTGELQFIHD